MKRFSFKLQSLLDHRRNLEEKERAELGRLTAQLLAARKRLENLQEQQYRVLSDLANLQRRGEDVQDFPLFCAFLDRVKTEMGHLRAEIAALERKAEAQKRAVVEAIRRRRLIETLRSRKMKEYLSAVDSEEQKAVDEMVVVHYPRRAV